MNELHHTQTAVSFNHTYTVEILRSGWLVDFIAEKLDAYYIIR